METASSLRMTVRGRDASNQLEFILAAGTTVRIGRAPENGRAVPWDLAISREHADLYWDRGVLRATCLPAARNPLIYQDSPAREAALRPGESFRIGKTTFEVTEEIIKQRSSPESAEFNRLHEFGTAAEEHSYSAEDLKKIAFRNSDQQLELLSKLPAMISGTGTEEELQHTVCGLLMEAIPQAVAVAVTHYDVNQLPKDEAGMDRFPLPLSMRVQTNNEFDSHFSPSRRIVLRTLKEQASVLYIWQAERGSEAFTITEGLGWAFCAPIRDESSQGWCMYVSGKGNRNGGFFVSRAALTADLRFTELVAQFIGSVRQVRALQEQRTQLSAFFSPKVITSLTANNSRRALTPAERDITVLFCDVRGFSRKSEQLQNQLLELLQSVSAALGVMVEGILQNDGAIADFQGDAALGFWGWPVEEENGPIPACLAAIEISSRFSEAAREDDTQLQGFSVGIGVAHGRAIAGQIGTSQQSKIGVFGPVVNQGARLESMTRQFGVSICIDGTTAEYAKQHLPNTAGRLHYLATVRPKGMSDSIQVYHLLPPEADFPEIGGKIISDYDDAIELVASGQWDDARSLLETLSDYGPAEFLVRQMKLLGNTPPESWDGVFSLERK